MRGHRGLLLAGYSSSATLDIGNPLLMPTIAAVVIGGARVIGGTGIYPGTFAGALFLSTLATAITVLSLSQGLRSLIEGASSSWRCCYCRASDGATATLSH